MSSVSPHLAPSARGNYLSAAIFIALSHLLILWMIIYPRPINTAIAGYAVFQAWLNLLGITAGAHRLWAHRSYEAHFLLRCFLAIIQLQSFQGSIRWWSEKHRVHHRFVDSELDPHSSRRGLWWSHCGWLFAPQVEIPNFHQLVPLDDLKSDPVVTFQCQYLLIGYLVFGGALPALQGWLIAGDWIGGLLWIGFVARFLSWHFIWFAHNRE
jgi:stearoyl-CoA desaturase (delta-9 desaturase)